MGETRRIFILILFAWFWVVNPPGVGNNQSSWWTVVPPAYGRNEEIDLENAAALVQQQTRGKILSAKEVEIEGRRRFQVKVLLPDSRIKVFLVNPETGKIE